MTSDQQRAIYKEAVMAVVNTNIGASVAQAALAKNERALGAAMEQLSTGKRINAAGDDASGLAISARMTSQIRGLETSIRNANDAISMVDTAEGALDEITEMLQRIRELAVQSGTGTTAEDDRTYLNAEFEALRSEIERVATNTEWNGRAILAGAAGGGSSDTVTFQVGVDGGQTLAVDFGDFSSGTTMASMHGATGLTASTVAKGIAQAASVITISDVAIAAVSNQRASFGASSNRLTHAVDNLTSVKTNAEASRSRILDTDYAAATSELARTQIIQQAGTAMLAQANQLPQSVLSLLQ
jgi:flagellin